MEEMWQQTHIFMSMPAATVFSVRNGILRHFLVYGAELCTKFLETRSVFGMVLPAAVHDPHNLQRAGAWCRHTVSWNATQPIKTGSQGLLAHLHAYGNKEFREQASACRSGRFRTCFVFFTSLHLISRLLIAHARVRCQAQGKSLPQQNTKAPHVTLGGVVT